MTPAYATYANTLGPTAWIMSYLPQPTPTSNGSARIGKPHTSQPQATPKDAHTLDAHAPATQDAKHNHSHPDPRDYGELMVTVLVCASLALTALATALRSTALAATSAIVAGIAFALALANLR